MKKIFGVITALFTVMLVNFFTPISAEAAWVAAIPIQIDTDKVERASDFNNYYWDIIIEKFPYPDYELIDDEKVGDAVPDDGLKSFDQKTLAELCDKIDSDIMIAMKLDNVYDRSKNFSREPTLECHMQGEFAGFNRITGKYYYKKFNYKDDIEEVLTYRNDWQQEAFASNLKRYINRTLEDKESKKKKYAN